MSGLLYFQASDQKETPIDLGLFFERAQKIYDQEAI